MEVLIVTREGRDCDPKKQQGPATYIYRSQRGYIWNWVLRVVDEGERNIKLEMENFIDLGSFS